ncbi:MAG TPA: HD domain-containing phosphohydrolase [Thermotogota bacterium]|nr:HD domain-containing phosphohydrolase [Thermotogota bacterium]
MVRKSFRRLVFWVSALILAGIAVTIGFFFFYSNERRSFRVTANEIRATNQTLNQMIAKIHQLNLLKTSWDQQPAIEYTETDDFKAIYELYKKDFDTVSGFLEKNRRSTNRVSIENYPYALFEGREATVIVDEIGDLIRSLNKWREELEEKIESLPINLFVVNLIAVFLSFISLFILSKLFFGFSRRIETAFAHFGALLDGNPNVEVYRPVWKEENRIHQTIVQLEQRIRFDRELIETQNLQTLEDLIPNLFPIIRERIGADRIAFAFVDNLENVIAETAVSLSGKIKLKAGFAVNIHRTTLDKLGCESPPRIIYDLEYHYAHVHQSEPTRLLLEEGVRSSITFPICLNNRILGFFFVSSFSKAAFRIMDAEFLKEIVSSLKYTILNSYILQQVIAVTAQTFADLVEKKDFETGNHIVRVSRLARMLAEDLTETFPEITTKFIREIFWFASLHDIGKVGIPDNILLKPAKLTPEEFEIMKTHVTIGESVIRQMQRTLHRFTHLEFLGGAIDAIIGHHEKWNGSGYPAGMKGDEIPLAGRILAVSDVFDALMSERPYKKAFSFEKSIEILSEGKGAHFDPRIVDAFFKRKEEVKVLYDKFKD